ncbi:hypothetical protein BH10BAC2_BH10BAC2_23050 [soil metagenome]
MKKYLLLYIIAIVCFTQAAFAQLQLNSPIQKKEVSMPFPLKTVIPASSKIVPVHIMEIKKPFVVAINPPELMAKARAKCTALKSLEPILTLKAERTNNLTASLQWETKYALKASGFNIERSLQDTFHFTTVDFAKVAAGSGIKKNYRLPSYNSYDDISFYRIKMFNYDTGYLYSNIASIKGYDARAFSIYPNPASDKVLVEITAKLNGNATIMLYDAAGKIVHQQLLNCIKGVRTQRSININTFAAGIYQVKILMPDKTWLAGTFVKA